MGTVSSLGGGAGVGAAAEAFLATIGNANTAGVSDRGSCTGG